MRGAKRSDEALQILRFLVASLLYIFNAVITTCFARRSGRGRLRPGRRLGRR